MVNFIKSLFGKKDSAVEASKIKKADNYFRWNCNSKYRLIGKINGLAEDVRRTRFHLVKRAKADKPVWILAARKQAVGADIRHHLLAYALMRGTPYCQLERKCHQKPSAQKILDIILLHGVIFSWTVEQVERWLDGEV